MPWALLYQSIPIWRSKMFAWKNIPRIALWDAMVRTVAGEGIWRGVVFTLPPLVFTR